MSEEKKDKSLDERDAFWDIESLVPPKKEVKRSAHPTFDTSTKEVFVARKEVARNTVRSESLTSTEFRRFVPPFTEKDLLEMQKPDLEYEKTGSLIQKVSVYNWQSKYYVSDRFTEDAKRFWRYKGEECAPVPFYSYTPQYAQMNKEQLGYYLWWRYNVRHGNYIAADYSYILLYVYELINLSELLDKKYCLDQLCEVWVNYGKKYPFVAKYLASWVCDFCLIHRLDAPIDKVKDFYPEIMREFTLKEFYIPTDNSGVSLSAESLIKISDAYDWSKSKYATKERKPVMKKHLLGALDYVAARLTENGKGFFTLGAEKLQVLRISYTGAHVSPSVKKRISVEYNSFAHSYQIRYLISDVLKYSENKLRKLWGIKSRLTIYALPNEIRGFIDEYFDDVLKNMKIANDIGRSSKRAAEEAEYEKLYYAPKEPLSLERASAIEDESWVTTKLLVDSFEEEAPTQIQPESVPNDTKTEQDKTNDLRSALGEKYEFLLAVLNEDAAAQGLISKELGSLPEVLVDEINEAAFDLLGDVIIEDDGEKFAVIEDYKEDIREGVI